MSRVQHPGLAFTVEIKAAVKGWRPQEALAIVQTIRVEALKRQILVQKIADREHFSISAPDTARTPETLRR
jgi:hypothetical protein